MEDVIELAKLALEAVQGGQAVGFLVSLVVIFVLVRIFRKGKK